MKKDIKLVSNFLNKEEDLVKYLIKSDYFRSTRKYDKESGLKNNFSNVMRKKYKDNIFLYYFDDEYILASLFFYKINGRILVNFFKNLDKYYHKFEIYDNIYKILSKPTNLIDLGAGGGFVTRDLSNLLNLRCVYCNLKGAQYDFAKSISNNETLFELIEDYSNRRDFDIVLMLDYIEHFEEPLIELEKIIEHLNPKIIIDSTDFNSNFVGHFEYYNLDNERVHHKKMSKIFINRLIEHGYTRKISDKIKYSNSMFWNGQFKIFIKE